MVVLGPILLARRSRSGRFVGAHRLLGRAYLGGAELLLRGRLRHRRLGRWVRRSSGTGRVALGGERPPLGQEDAA